MPIIGEPDSGTIPEEIKQEDAKVQTEKGM